MAYSSANPTGNNWSSNAATDANGGGLTFTDEYGFGIVDAHAAVRLAETWDRQSTYDNLVTVSSGVQDVDGAIEDGESLVDTVTISGDPIIIDQVEVNVQLTHEYIGDLLLEITSPGGTTSTLLNRALDGDYEGAGELDFTFNSVQFWGEVSTGDWSITVTDTETGDEGILDSWSLSLLGDLANDDSTYIFTDDWNTLGTDAARNTIEDTAGTDTLNFAAMTGTVDVDLTPSAVSSVGDLSMLIDSNAIIENVIGGDGADTLSGNSADNVIRGMRGNDLLIGQAGDDRLIGSAGNDVIQGGYGEDTAVFSGAKSNYAVLTQASGTTIVFDKTGADGIDEVSGVEKLVFADQTVVLGTVNEISGTSSRDASLAGTTGEDIISGLAGDDTISGLAGNDYIVGGAGSDTIRGGLGEDAAAFSGSFNEYTITTSSDGSIQVSHDDGGADGTDILTGIETLEFSDARITVGDQNPILVGDTQTVNEGASLTINASTLLANDFDFQQAGSSLKIVSVTSAKFGELSVSGRDANDNIVSLSYGPKSNNTDFNGLDTFTYTVADQDGNQVTAAVSIDVVPVNDAPEATTAKVLGIEDAVVSGKLTGSDVDGDALSFALVSAPSSGTLSISPNGTYTYTAASDFLDAGTSQTFNFTYSVSDGTETVQRDVDLVVMAATENDDVIYGGEGRDTIYAGTGDDVIDGGAGDDILDGGLGNDTFKASYGSDTIVSGGGVDTLSFAAGQTISDIQYVDADLDGFNDDLAFTFADGGSAELHTVTVLDQTTDAVEIVKFDFNEDGTVDSSAERFRLASSLDAGSSSTNTIIIGTDGSDEIGGSNFNDVIFGYGGDDVISGRKGDDRIDGGLGNDTVSFSDLSDGINVDLNDGSASGTTAGSDTLINVENVIGSAGADIIAGDDQNNILAGGAGNDVVSGGAGDDQLTGGAGTDTISFVGDNSGVSVSLTDGASSDGADSGSDELDGFENVIGGDGDDVIIGSDGANRLDGGAGNDLLTALGGDDEIIGGSGIDTASFDTLSDDVSVDLSSGTVSGVETGNDTISGVENIVTGDGSDTVLGDNSDNIIRTGRGADTIDGGQEMTPLMVGQVVIRSLLALMPLA